VDVRLVLASQSPARLATLRAAGLDPEVVVSGVDESQLDIDDPARLAVELARLKAGAVAVGVQAAPGERVLVVGCDSVLELGGEIHGKPSSPQDAVSRWRRMRGRSGVLHTGHCVIELGGTVGARELSREARTVVHFSDLSDAEIAAYVDSGEPLRVAGAFTLDGLGGAYVSGIEGDPHTVVGIGLPLLRELVRELGHEWHTLWRAPQLP
jgi:septum formation protein